MTRAYRFLLLALLLGLYASLTGVAWAQSPPTTGTPPFGSFGGGPEAINLANNNVHWDVPVLAKAGRGGFNFTYDLSYDSSVWAGGVSSGTSIWYPIGNWGWRGITEASTGYLSYTSTQHFACQIWTLTITNMIDTLMFSITFIATATLMESRIPSTSR